jgi:ABC-type glycerol-3-phosphate transport system substrate-binding protein
VRKLALISLLLVAVLALAACGGGGSSSSGGSSTSSEEGAAAESTSAESTAAATPEGAWAEEITATMSEFENKASALIEQIHTSTSHQILEPLYAAYAVNLTVLSNKIESTKAPAACVAVRKKLAGYTSQVAALAKSLSHSPKLTPEQYAAKGFNQGLKIDKLGHQLGTLAANPTC